MRSTDLHCFYLAAYYILYIGPDCKPEAAVYAGRFSWNYTSDQYAVFLWILFYCDPCIFDVHDDQQLKRPREKAVPGDCNSPQGYV